MLLRGNPSLPPAAGRFVLQDAVPKRTNVTRPTARIASWISRGNSSPPKPSFLDSSGKDNPPPRNPRTENSLSVSPVSRPPPSLSPRRGSRSSRIQELFLLAPIGPERSSPAWETVVLRLLENPRGTGKRGENRTRIGVLENRSAAEVPFRWFKL